MEVQPRSTLAEYNQVTRRETRRRFLLIVILPMLLSFACVIALTVLAALRPDQGIASRSTFAQIATIFLIAPMCLMSLVQLALVAGLIFAVVKLSGALPPVFFKVHGLIRRVQFGVERATGVVTRPMIAGHARVASVKRFARVLRAGPRDVQSNTP